MALLAPHLLDSRWGTPLGFSILAQGRLTKMKEVGLVRHKCKPPVPVVPHQITALWRVKPKSIKTMYGKYCNLPRCLTIDTGDREIPSNGQRIRWSMEIAQNLGTIYTLRLTPQTKRQQIWNLPLLTPPKIAHFFMTCNTHTHRYGVALLAHTQHDLWANIEEHRSRELKAEDIARNSYNLHSIAHYNLPMEKWSTYFID